MYELCAKMSDEQAADFIRALTEWPEVIMCMAALRFEKYMQGIKEGRQEAIEDMEEEDEETPPDR